MARDVTGSRKFLLCGESKVSSGYGYVVIVYRDGYAEACGVEFTVTDVDDHAKFADEVADAMVKYGFYRKWDVGEKVIVKQI